MKNEVSCRDALPNYRLRFLILCAAFVAVFLASFVIGRYAVSLTELFPILWSGIKTVINNLFGASLPVIEGTEATVILKIRLPRIIAAAAVGASLSTAGAAYQGMFRNPMVSPDILGSSSGAAFGAALGILAGVGYMGISLFSFVTGLAAVLLAYAISRASRLKSSTLSMVLAGMVVGSLFSSSTSFIKLIADTEDTLPEITYWLMGSLSSIKAEDTWFILIICVISTVPLLLLRWRINLLTVSEDEARSLGINTGALRIIVIVCATLMTAGSVAVSGLIGWVGLVIPHFCRMIFGYDYRRLIPASLLFGSTFLMLVDNISRAATTSEIPIGILTSFVGAPVFIWLILSGGVNRESRD